MVIDKPKLAPVEKKEILPENVPTPDITLEEVNTQLGHLNIQLLQARKTELRLRDIIKNLREKSNASS